MSNPDQPALVVNGDVASLTFPGDDYALDFRQVSLGKYGALYAEVTARHGASILHVARFDLLNQREQENFQQRCVSVNSSVADWQSRLQSAIPGLRKLVTSPGTTDPGAVWQQAITAHDFLLQQEADVLAHVKDLVVPGCITEVSAPRASGKSLVALYLGVALSKGGVFRAEQLTQRRVLLVDRDNPPSLVRKRLGYGQE